MPRVTFEPMGNRVECDDGETVFDVARRAGVMVETACVGKGTCGLCRVKIHGSDEGLTPVGPIDERHLGNVYFLTKVRLACQAIISGDVIVEAVPKRRSKKK